jgi:hypothetical protein
MPPSTGAVSGPPTIVFFTANPSSLTKLDLDGELRAIEDELEKVGLRDVLRLQSRPDATPADLQRVLLAERPTVVQLSGHGRGRVPGSHARRGAATTRELVLDVDAYVSRPTGIMLHGDRPGETKVVSGEALGHLFSTVGPSIRLVVLNACHSAEQAAAILEHVDFVVGIDGAILDTAAKAFAVAFYRALAHGQTIAAAFDLGVNQLMLEGLGEDVRMPVLEVRAGADARQARLVAAPKTEDDAEWDVYITYAAVDREIVRQLAVELHERKLRVFFDEWTVGYGTVTSRRLEEGLRNALHGIVAASPRTMTEPWVKEQYAALLDNAVMRGRRLIPVLIGSDEADLPPFLRTRTPVTLGVETGDAHRQAIDAIARAIRGLPPGPPPRRR